MAEKKMTDGSMALQEKQYRVITIEATEKPQDIKLRVAAYARVSSASDDQLNSFAAQNNYYTTLISGKENWSMVDIYADEGITGTSAEKREDFQRLMADCRRGLIDRVLVKSISRFARNTKECLEAIRELKLLGIGVYFEKENIDTATMSGEMMTALFASFAQAESESISSNMRWSYQRRMQSGEFITCKAPFGYRLRNGRLEIEESEAEIIRLIFNRYLSGHSAADIASEITSLGVSTRDGTPYWQYSTICYILQNEKYAGDSRLQKYYATDMLPVQKKRNQGNKDQYYIAGSHPPIVERSVFDKVQVLYKAKGSEKANRPRNRFHFTLAIVCGNCGTYFRRKECRGIPYWTCRKHNNNKKDCGMEQIQEAKIEEAFLRLYYNLKHYGEPINTLEADSEILITMLGAFAQAESESISANVRWGKRQAMREGKTIIQYKRLYAYEKGEDGKPKIIPEQAEVVRSIYDQYLTGASLRMIKDRLEAEHIPNVAGEPEWTITAIRSILTNEKYCGDVLLQKTYISDCISRKVIRNTGQLPMYLVQNNHDGIVDRKTFDAVQAEMARRNAGKSPSKKNAPTGMTSYASKYALSERLVCGECGTLYRRCTWAKRGKKRVVWRCVSRLDYGTKYCHSSPTLDEEPLQRSILAAINSAMSQKSTLIRQITGAMELELAPIPGESMSLADIERRLEELNNQTRELVAKAARAEDASAYTSQLKAVMDEAAALKEKRTFIEEQRKTNAQAVRRIEDAAAAMEQASAEISEWDEALIRQLVDTVKVISAEKITVYLRGGIQIEQDMIQ